MILFQIILLLLLIYIIFLLSYSLLRGAPYAAIGKKRMETIFRLLEIRSDKKFLDLGSGDGRIVIAAAKKGVDASGFEINPLLVLISNYKIKKLKLKNAKILLTDFWGQDFSSYDYVTIWGTQHIMPQLEKKLLKELHKGSRVVSNHFRFPNWKQKKTKNDVYLYIK